MGPTNATNSTAEHALRKGAGGLHLFSENTSPCAGWHMGGAGMGTAGCDPALSSRICSNDRSVVLPSPRMGMDIGGGAARRGNASCARDQKIGCMERNRCGSRPLPHTRRRRCNQKAPGTRRQAAVQGEPALSASWSAAAPRQRRDQRWSHDGPPVQSWTGIPPLSCLSRRAKGGPTVLTLKLYTLSRHRPRVLDQVATATATANR